MNPDLKTSFLLALLKSRETRIITREHARRFSSVKGRAEAAGNLEDTEIGQAVPTEAVIDPVERDRRLWLHFSDTISQLESLPVVPDDARDFSRAYLLKYDVANLKAVLLALELARQPRLIPAGALYRCGCLDELAAAQSADSVIELLIRCGLRALAPPFGTTTAAGGPRARVSAEAALEGEYCRILARTARDMRGGAVLSMACGRLVDFANLSLLFRFVLIGTAAEAGGGFIPGGYLLETDALRSLLSHNLPDIARKLDPLPYRTMAAEVSQAWEASGSLTVPDEIMEKHRIETLRGLLAAQVAPAPAMAWFVVLKEIELRNLRLLLKVAAGTVPFEAIEKHLHF